MKEDRSKDYIVYYSIKMIFRKRQLHRNRKLIRGYQGMAWGRRLTTKGHKKNFRGDRNISDFYCGSNYINEYLCLTSRNLIPKMNRFNHS